MILGVIPARYGSSRFPGKPLARVNGTPLIQLVWERAKAAKRLERLLVATDDPRIGEVVRRFGGEAVMTPKDLPSGTDRVWQAAQGTPARIVVNIQGDEPLITPGMVDRLVEGLEREPKAQMATLRYAMKGVEGQEDPNVVKVVADADRWALYFSRSPIPHFRGARINPGTATRKSGSVVWYKHLGLYGYRREALQQFVGWPSSALEQAEGLEQLRALERGMRIKVLDSPHNTVGVDTPDDLKRVEEMLSRA